MNDFSFYLVRPGWPLSDEVSYSPGKKFHCPNCDSAKIGFVFKPGFGGKDVESWCSIIHDRGVELCNRYEMIMQNNYSPLWLCKDCFDGGVVLQI